MVFKNKRMIIIACILAAAVIITGAVLAVIFLHGDSEKQEIPDIPTSAEPIIESEPITAAPNAIIGVRIEAGVDFKAGDGCEQRIDALLTDALEDGNTCVIAPVMGDGGAYYTSGRYAIADGNDYLRAIASSASARSLMLYAAVDPTRSANGVYDVSSDEALQAVTSEITNLCANYNLSGIVLELPDMSVIKPDYSSYAKKGGGIGYDEYCKRAYALFVRELCSAVRKSGSGVCIGAEIPADNIALAIELTRNGALNFVTVTDLSFDMKPEGGFDTSVKKWIDTFKEVNPLYFELNCSAVGSNSVTENTLIAQAERLIKLGNNGFVKTSAKLADAFNDLTICLNSAKDESFGINELSITSPSSNKFVTYSDSISFIGAFDPLYPLTVNGSEIKSTDTGYFSFDAKLKKGVNTFVFEHKGSKKTYSIEFRDIIIKSIYPATEQWVNGGTAITVSAVAKNGSQLWARLGNETVQMTYSGGASNDAADMFASYVATFKTPDAQDVPTEIGSLIVTATLNGVSETKAGGRVYVRAIGSSSESVSSLPPDAAYESGYGIAVGQGDRYVAEVCIYETETLDVIKPTDERSRPTNANLPMGTVDYCTDADELYYNPESGKTNAFRTLAFGKRVYSDKNIKIFKAILPEVNAITAVDCTNDGRHTSITFDTAWKAPFNLTLSPQEYKAPYKKNGRPDYSITETSYEYVDIEFCYTKSGQGTIDLENDPVFTRAEWVKGSRGYYVLRLWLRQKGKFYGWSAKYNEDNQLVFTFLNPVQISEANNKYGYSLKGAKIVIDAGHGGKYSPGAVGSSKQYTEAVLNLILARKVQRELENLGATVIMTRTSDTTLSLEDRNKITVSEQPDLFISIHRNSSESSASRGYEDFYYYPYSKALADAVYKTSATNFTAGRGVQFYPFYVARVTCCPSILTENGFMSNSADLEMIKTEAHNEKLAKSITQGVVNYLASIRTTAAPVDAG